ncbi:hypothetical protein [Micromonospora sp. DPT]
MTRREPVEAMSHVASGVPAVSTRDQAWRYLIGYAGYAAGTRLAPSVRST